MHDKSTKPRILRSPTYICGPLQPSEQPKFSLSPLFLPFSCDKTQINYLNTMKLSGLLAASVAAASATVISISAPAKVTYQDGLARKCHKESSSVRTSSGNKFAPRFDGLRFIETLVTAHR